VTRAACGVVCDALDVDSVTRGITEALNNPAWGIRAREFAMTKTPQKMADEYVALYRELLSQQRA
jgi:glycosyltransferase involved in cell wall biosynthesis